MTVPFTFGSACSVSFSMLESASKLFIMASITKTDSHPTILVETCISTLAPQLILTMLARNLGARLTTTINYLMVRRKTTLWHIGVDRTKLLKGV